MTIHETAVAALQSQLQTHLGTLVPVRRGGTLSDVVEADGVVVIVEDDPGEPEYTLSPLHSHYEHRVELQLVVPGETADRDTRLDALREAVMTAVRANRQLNGTVRWADVRPGAVVDLPVEGGEALRAANVTVTLYYSVSEEI